MDLRRKGQKLAKNNKQKKFNANQMRKIIIKKKEEKRIRKNS
jgi:hypothetical protein